MIRTTNHLPGATGYTFNDAAADHAVKFFQTYLRHSKGRWAGHRFTLEPWQRDDIIRPLFGWQRPDGTRRYRHAYIELPRKNGKSTLAAGLALYLLSADNEPGAEVYSCAADREQARIVFAQARQMVEAAPALLKRLKPFRNAITYPKRGGSYKVLSADAPTKHGLNSSGIVFDELHAQPNRELFDVMDTSIGARTQPIMIMITTAGYDLESVCYEQHTYATQVATGAVEDPSWFVYIAAAQPNDDWRSASTWRRCNPGYGVTIGEEYLREQVTKAIKSPAYENTFKRLHLNLWTSQETKWLSRADWDACATPLPDLAGRPCHLGLDLASKTDVAALVAAFLPIDDDPHIYLLPFFFVPGANLDDLGDRNRAPYFAWARDGHLLATDGVVIDYAAIERQIAELAATYTIGSIAVDPWNAAQMAQNLTAQGFDVVEYRQGYKTMSPASKEFEARMLDHTLAHAGHPVLRWMADNVMILRDSNDNIKPDKAKSRQKIDGIIAAIMAVDLALRNDPNTQDDQRGIRIL
jgi:phage terminase large subunit-like protein